MRNIATTGQALFAGCSVAFVIYRGFASSLICFQRVLCTHSALDRCFLLADSSGPVRLTVFVCCPRSVGCPSSYLLLARCNDSVQQTRRRRSPGDIPRKCNVQDAGLAVHERTEQARSKKVPGQRVQSEGGRGCLRSWAGWRGEPESINQPGRFIAGLVWFCFECFVAVRMNKGLGWEAACFAKHSETDSH